MSKDIIQLTPGSVKKATVGVSSGDLWKMPRDRIRVIDGFNVREKDADYKANVRRYADSMKANGYDETKPMAGFVFEENGEHFIGLTDGHTRLDAVDLAISEGCEIVTIPVVTKARGTSMEDITIGLVTSNSGAALKPLEVAKVCKRLVGYGMEVKEIATRLTLTPAYVNQLLDLLAAPKAVRDLVANGTVAATLAMETIKKHGKEATKMLTAGVKEAKGTGKSRVTAKHVKAATAPKVSPQKGKKVAVPETPAQQTLPGVAFIGKPEKVYSPMGWSIYARNEKTVQICSPENVLVTLDEKNDGDENSMMLRKLGLDILLGQRPTDTDGVLELGRVWMEENIDQGTPESKVCNAMLAFIAGVPLEQVQALFDEPSKADADDEQL
jgi:predicted transcriptional regulator